MSELETYRGSARTWLESVAPTFGRAARGGLSVEQDIALGRRYQRAKFDAGYAGINWSTDVGGQGLTHIEKLAFDTEEMVFGMPNGYFGISLGMPVPILIRFGADKDFMKERVLAALKGEEIWCSCSASPRADRTWRACAPVPKSTATAGSLTARSCGPVGLNIAITA